MLGEVRQKLQEYNDWNRRCRKEAVRRHDEKAITFNDNVIYAIEKALSIVDEVERGNNDSI